MLHILKFRFKCMIRNHSLLFWTLAFPLILTTLFGAILTSAYDTPKFDTIPIAIVNTKTYQEDTILKETMNQVKLNDKAMFQVQAVSSKEAKKLLKDGDVDAIVEMKDTPHIEVAENGLNQTIVESFFNEYVQQRHMVLRLMEEGHDATTLTDVFKDTQSYIQTQNEENTNLMSVFFYTILAMNAMFGGYWSINSMFELQANQSSRAARVSMAPTHKAMNLFCDFLLNILFQVIIMAIVFFYIYVVIDISFGTNIWFILLALFTGIIAGNGLGTVIGCHFPKMALDGKTGVLTSITMLGSFLAGMMMVTMKYIVQAYLPILAYINPVNMLTDALYAQYYYGVGDRYFLNLGLLLVFSILCYGISYVALRRQQYQSLEVR